MKPRKMPEVPKNKRRNKVGENAKYESLFHDYYYSKF